MKNHSRRFSSFRAAISLLVCFLTLASIPGQAQAALLVPQMITNTVSEFTNGSFQRTQLSSTENPSVSSLDKAGAAQLTPIGLFEFSSQTTARLPYQLVRMGAVTVGNRIFVIGGVANGSKTDTNGNVIGTYNNESVGEVYSAQILTTATQDLPAGSIDANGWQKEPSIPEAKSSDIITPTASIVNSPATVAVTNSGKSYIYVIGGNTQVRDPKTGNLSTVDFSSYAVRMAAIGSNGRISSWSVLSAAQLPPLPSGFTGLQGASAVTMTINGSAYVYVLGGLTRYFDGGTNNIREVGSRSILWAKVDASTGKLFKPSAPTTEGWDTVTTGFVLPNGLDQNAGIWDASAVAGQYNINSEDLNVDRVIYVFGGQLVSNRFNGSPTAVYNSKVYQIYVSSTTDNGQLVGQPQIGDWQTGTLPEARFGLGAVTFNGKHYLTGGAFADLSPKRDMLTTYVEDNLQFPEFGGSGGANFLKDETGLLSPRVFHGMVIVPVGDSAYVYVLGGQTNAINSTTPAYTDEIMYGRVGGVENVQATGFPADGWYYSNAITFNFRNAEIQEMSWGTVLTPTIGMDIEIQYRTSTANDCSSPGWDVTSWVAIDGETTTPGAEPFSKNGDNTIPLSNIQARCFQYRAHLIGTRSPGVVPTQTPTLLYLSLKILIPGSPDVRADKPGDVVIQQNALGQLVAIDIRIRNQNDSTEDPTLDANAEGKGGSFFVDIYMYKQGDNIVEPTIPISGSDANNIACASIDKTELPANAIYSVSQWYVASANTDCKTNPVSLLNYVAQRGTGTYTMFVVVDSSCGSVVYGCVDERDAQNGEGNNVTRYDFTIPSTVTSPVAYQQVLPLINRTR